MVFRFLNRLNANEVLFNGHYVDVRSFYVQKFNRIPSVTFIGDIDVTKVGQFLYDTMQREAREVYQHSYLEHDDKEVYFTASIVVLTSKRIIELTDNFCQVLHTIDQRDWVKQLAIDISQFRTEENVACRHTHVVGFAKSTEMN